MKPKGNKNLVNQQQSSDVSLRRLHIQTFNGPIASRSLSHQAKLKTNMIDNPSPVSKA